MQPRFQFRFVLPHFPSLSVSLSLSLCLSLDWQFAGASATAVAIHATQHLPRLMHFNGSQMSTQSEKLQTKITFHSVSAKNLNNNNTRNNNNNSGKCTRMRLKTETKTENEWNVELQCNEIKIAFHLRRARAIFYCILCCVSDWGCRYFWTRTPQALFVHHASLKAAACLPCAWAHKWSCNCNKNETVPQRQY